MTTPTKTAEDSFKFAKGQLQGVKANGDDMHPQLRSALMNMCWGFREFVYRAARDIHQARAGGEGIAETQSDAIALSGCVALTLR